MKKKTVLSLVWSVTAQHMANSHGNSAENMLETFPETSESRLSSF